APGRGTVKAGHVRSAGGCGTASSARMWKTAGRGSFPTPGSTVLHILRGYMGKTACLPASSATRKRGSATTGRALKGITTAFRTPGRWRGLSGAGKVHKAARLDSFFLSRRRINKKGQPSTSCPFKIDWLQGRVGLPGRLFLL